MLTGPTSRPTPRHSLVEPPRLSTGRGVWPRRGVPDVACGRGTRTTHARYVARCRATRGVRLPALLLNAKGHRGARRLALCPLRGLLRVRRCRLALRLRGAPRLARRMLPPPTRRVAPHLPEPTQAQDFVCLSLGRAACDGATNEHAAPRAECDHVTGKLAAEATEVRMVKHPGLVVTTPALATPSRLPVLRLKGLPVVALEVRVKVG